jgi:hypothetical protein
MLLASLAAFLISVVISIAEAGFERDWPRDTFKFVVIFGIILLIVLQHG